MGKTYHNQQCEICRCIGIVRETWGHRYCKLCDAKRINKRTGHSGMLRVEGLKPIQPLPLFWGLELEITNKGNKLFSTLYLEHYPRSKGIMGRQLNYFIKRDGKVIGIIGVNSPPLNYKKFRNYFHTENEKLFVNNNVFRIVETEKNLGTKILKLLRKKITIDYYKKYGDKLIGIVTFVEPPRTGALYRADNWDYLGETEGMRVTLRSTTRNDWQNKKWEKGTKKFIFAKRIE